MPGSVRAAAAAAVAALSLGLASPALASSQLVVQAAPEGATVNVDGQAAGRAPTLVEVPAGRHRIRVEAPGHAERLLTVDTVDGLTTRRHVTLSVARPRRGELRITSAPRGAEVYLDGEWVGRAPLFLASVRPGPHRLVLARDGYEHGIRRVDVIGGLTAEAVVSLTPLPVPQPAVTQAEAPRERAPRPQEESAAAPHVAAARPAPPRRRPAPVSAVIHDGAELDAPAPAVVAPAPVSPPRPGRHLSFGWLFVASLLAGAIAWACRPRRPRAAVSGLSRTSRVPQEPCGVLPWPGRDPLDIGSFEAHAALARGQAQKAALAMSRVLASEPGTAWHLYHLGLALARAGRRSEAEAAYRTALQLEPGHREAAFNLAGLLGADGQWAEAVIAYRRMVQARPDDVDALHGLGCAYAALGMASQARLYGQAASDLRRRTV